MGIYRLKKTGLNHHMWLCVLHVAEVVSYTCMVILLDSSKITMIYTRADLAWFSRKVAKNRAQSG